MSDFTDDAEGQWAEYMAEVAEVGAVAREMRESARKTRSRHRARKLKAWADRLDAARKGERAE